LDRIAELLDFAAMLRGKKNLLAGVMGLIFLSPPSGLPSEMNCQYRLSQHRICRFFANTGDLISPFNFAFPLGV
jgi:hypothetical protein